MTPKQFERMAKCDHGKTCGRLVTLKASSYADPYHWCLCGECPYYTTENAKLREFAAETWELLACNEPVFVWKGLREKARELGVEVDG